MRVLGVPRSAIISDVVSESGWKIRSRGQRRFSEVYVKLNARPVPSRHSLERTSCFGELIMTTSKPISLLPRPEIIYEIKEVMSLVGKLLLWYGRLIGSAITLDWNHTVASLMLPAHSRLDLCSRRWCSRQSSTLSVKNGTRGGMEGEVLGSRLTNNLIMELERTHNRGVGVGALQRCEPGAQGAGSPTGRVVTG
uniref:Uncharacterized protein n=1 Tax=Brassica campestris TaxID=3711 RepID=M4DHU4_BRACM